MEKDDPTKSLALRSEALVLNLNRPSNSVFARVKRATGAVLGGGMTLFSGLLALGVLLAAPGHPLARVIGACAFLVGTGTAGALLMRSMIRSQRLASSAALAAEKAWPTLALAIRQRLLMIASHHGGRLTAAELAATLAIAQEPAERALDDATQSGEARLLFSPDGIPVYEFPGLIAAKTDAKEPWEH